MKRILLAMIFFIAIGTHLNAVSFEENKKACDDGNVVGCTNLANAYFNGDGVNIDQNKAVELYTKSCNGGYIVGCYTLANLYRDGVTVRRDHSKAIELYTKTCDDGLSVACTQLNILSPNNQELKKNSNMVKKEEIQSNVNNNQELKKNSNMVKKEEIQSAEMHKENKNLDYAYLLNKIMPIGYWSSLALLMVFAGWIAPVLIWYIFDRLWIAIFVAAVIYLIAHPVANMLVWDVTVYPQQYYERGKTPPVTFADLAEIEEGKTPEEIRQNRIYK